MNIIKKIILGVVTLLAMTAGAAASSAEDTDEWVSYLDTSVGRNVYYLYSQVMMTSFQEKHNYRALSLGAGAGDVDVDLAAKGWDVTSVDSSPRAGEIIAERMKFMHGQYHFQQTDFNSARLDGYYDFVISLFALPFGDKKQLPALMKNISQHTRGGAMFVVTFFGNEHTFVKKGFAYGMTKDEVTQLFAANGFKLRYFLNRHYTQSDVGGQVSNWDLRDVIAEKI